MFISLITQPFLILFIYSKVYLFLLQKYSYKDNLIGYELGMVIVFSISALAGQIIQSFIPEWSIGLLGLIPIYMGIKGEDDDDKNDEKHQSNKGVIAVLLMYLVSCGADNIAVYVPVLATMPVTSIVLTVIYFIFLTAVSLTLAYFFGQIPIIKNIFERFGEPLSRIIYIFIGIFVMIDTGLFQQIMNLF